MTDHSNRPSAFTLSSLSRRDALRGFGFAGLVVLLPRGAGAQSVDPSCVLTPEQTEGPYYLDTALLRSDITEGRPGIPLQLSLTVVDASTCTAIPNAVVDIWHADASGTYSGYAAEGTAGETFCRGIQVTDASGGVTFQSMYPGWYRGRTTHIHIKVHVGSSTVVTSQLYFPDAVSDAVYAQSPYNTDGQRDTTNETDGILGGVDDESAVLVDVTLQNGTYVAAVTLGIAGSGATTTTTTPGATTTTTTPPGSASCAGAGFAVARCQTTELRGAVTDAVDDGMLRRRLLRALDRRVTARIERADTLASDGKPRRARALLGRAIGGLTGFNQALASRKGQQEVAADVRATLAGSAQALGAALATLRQELA